ncbi:unnamed protein product [Hydatigera taeniaeformis]|uniref:HOOK domain-containing protein n=1 Tax=Hydatigena taeniaeformis TaxID=6205 RepID=A0A0R3X2G8_HYDTA|nr:unnamed protein product [Hydatigera taeniaeformis]
MVTFQLNVTKLQLSSKRQAIEILSQQLEDAKKEAHQFKLMSEQLKVKLNESEMHNRILETEISNLRKRNADLLEDINLLKKSMDFGSSKCKVSPSKERLPFETQARESLIEQLEIKTLECQRIKRDLELCNEEKQEILSELIHFKKLDEIDVNGVNNTIDVESVLQENKLLYRRIGKLEADNKLLTQALTKYQVIL